MDKIKLTKVTMDDSGHSYEVSFGTWTSGMQIYDWNKDGKIDERDDIFVYGTGEGWIKQWGRFQKYASLANDLATKFNSTIVKELMDLKQRLNVRPTIMPTYTAACNLGSNMFGPRLDSRTKNIEVSGGGATDENGDQTADWVSFTTSNGIEVIMDGSSLAMDGECKAYGHTLNGLKKYFDIFNDLFAK